MPRHEHYLELAAAAAAGDVDPDSFRDLQGHLDVCADCKRAYREYLELHVPLAGQIDAELDALIESKREKVKGAILNAVAARDATQPMATVGAPRTGSSKSAWKTVRVAGQVLAIAAAIVLAFRLGVRYERTSFADARPQADLHEQSASSPPMKPVAAGQPRDNASQNQEKLALAQMAEELVATKRQNAALDATLTQKQGELAATQRLQAGLQQRLESETADRQRTEAALLDANAKVKQLETAKTSDSDTLIALRYQVQELTEKLKEQKDSLDRERQLLASGRDIRDIIGARNLHIIDVYDTDPYGNTKKSFARAFYTEGKSLIFYAYDLPPHRTEEGKYAYTAWGQHNGDKDKVLNLGILLNDDKGQKRWVLNFSDPKVLAEIDSVFITLERAGFEGNRPSGKRLLTAYLASQVNHP